MTKYLVDYFRAHGRPGALEEVLARAGETRDADVLADESTWTSYGEFRRLLEAAASVLGSADHLTAVAASCMESVSSPEFTAALQDLGSPSVLYASIADASASLTTILEMQAEEVGPTEWVLYNRFPHGFEPFPEYCSFGIGLISVPPMLFGLPPAEVVEEECQARGAAACRFRVTWVPDTDLNSRIEYLSLKAEVAEARLRAVQSTAADIVSGGELADVLTRIVGWTERAVRATGYLLVADAAPLGGRWVAAEGLSEQATDDLIGRLARGETGGDQSMCVAEIVSEHRSYGSLVTVHDNGRRLFPQEIAVVDSHARLAAAALDSACAVHEAQRQAATANALLQLSSSLTQLAGVGEMADRVARAIPQVVDCDRASVVLMDPADPTSLRFAGMWGYPPAVEANLRAQVFPGYPSDMADAVDLWDIRDVADTALRTHMAESGSAALARVPIYLNGVAGGAVIASVTDRPGRLTGDPAVADRLRGIAAQAGTAINNARLLDRIQHQALHDALTGLPNRALIMDRASQMLRRARRDGRPVAALFIDLDNFKDVNDGLGHEAGDAVLNAVARRFTSCLRASDTVGRMGGDEFVVLADARTMQDGPDVVAERLFRALAEPFVLEDKQASLVITASIGIAVADRVSADELLRMADIALYRAKAAGRACHALFAPEMETEVLRRIEMELQLRAALENGEFLLDYQPIFRLRDGQMVGAEALIRWHHPTRGRVAPGEFIPSLEQTGLIDDVGRWVLNTACRQSVEWERAGHPIGMSVNLSARQLSSPALVDDVRDALETAGLEPGRLTLEITETSLMIDAADAEERLTALRALGVHLAVDDFGTGYSSFAYLRRFPVESLKIDRSFVNDVSSDEGQALLRVMLGLGRSLGLATVAEGIESAEQLDWLELESCAFGQGFHQARPMPPDALLEVLESREAARPVNPRT